MSAQRANSSQAFVAMWFDKTMTAAFKNGLELAIGNAGYEPLRIDRKEHDRKIYDEIIAEIRRSAFVVADFTHQRGGVYYEAGFAHGLGKRVIFTCKKLTKGEELHFDVRQYNTIFWETPENLIAPLQNRILALFGAGPLKPDAKPIPV
jgi:nucleoside 2-deoxyribosyltransferase